jgi:serine protease Do
MQKKFDQFQDIVLQISTPYSTGTGVYLGEYELIVTNEHVVKGFKEVVVDGKKIDKQLLNVLMLDAKLDLAIIQAPINHSLPTIRLDYESMVNEGDKIAAVGHPFDLNLTTTQGIVSSLAFEDRDISYIQHDAALNPGNSGGPLVSEQGLIIGLNTYIYSKGQSIGFSLPASYIYQVISAFVEAGKVPCVKCTSCQKLAFETQDPHNNYCQKCGAAVTFISQIPAYEPHGISHTVEVLINSLGFDVALARKGPFNWQLDKGSASVQVSYYEKSGLLVGDVVICTLPDEQIVEVYSYLLTQNFFLEGLTLAVKGNDVIVSMLVYDQYLKMSSLTKLFKNLIEKGDEMDNYIVETFGGKWKSLRMQFER